MHSAPFCSHNMSKCTSQCALHDGVVCIHVPVHIDALIFVAKLLSDINCRNLLIVSIKYASCECYNFVFVDPMMMILICTCYDLHDLHVDMLCIHVRVHINTLISVAKVHVAVNC